MRIDSISGMSDATGINHVRFAYDPWGVTVKTNLTAAPPVYPLAFTGQYQDPAGGVGAGLDIPFAEIHGGRTYAYLILDPASWMSGSGRGRKGRALAMARWGRCRL